MQNRCLADVQQCLTKCKADAWQMYNSANKLQHFPGKPTSWVSYLETRRSGEKCSFTRRIPRMPPKQALSPDQIQEIRGLRGKTSAAEAKKFFGIRSDRLYKIWKSSEHDSALVPAEQPLSIVEDEPAHASSVAQDFYVHLGRLEAGMHMLREILE